MSRGASVVSAVLLLLPVSAAEPKFKRYKPVEAYEIRPGVLAMPRYSANGQVCEIALETLHYSPEMVRLNSSLSRNEITQIFDELVPSAERGPQPTNPVEQIAGGFTSGRAMITDQEYQNISIKVYGELSSSDTTAATLNEVAALLKWKARKCR